MDTTEDAHKLYSCSSGPKKYKKIMLPKFFLILDPLPEQEVNDIKG